MPTAVTIPHLSWQEAAALAEHGARVPHPRTIAPLEEAGIPAVIANARCPDAPRTRVAAEPGLRSGRQTAVTSKLHARKAEVVVLGAAGSTDAERAARALTAARVVSRQLSPSEDPPVLRALVRAAEHEAAVRMLHDAFVAGRPV